jgi:hypothetical protein
MDAQYPGARWPGLAGSGDVAHGLERVLWRGAANGRQEARYGEARQRLGQTGHVTPGAGLQQAVDVQVNQAGDDALPCGVNEASVRGNVHRLPRANRGNAPVLHNHYAIGDDFTWRVDLPTNDKRLHAPS